MTATTTEHARRGPGIRSSRPEAPQGHAITPRDIVFGRDETIARWWDGGDPVGTHFYNALSATFPQGERFFMDAVKRCRDDAAPELRDQIDMFLAQEAMHGREHQFFNRQVATFGYDVGALERRVRRRLDIARRFPPHVQLAATCALEHFTAIMAHALLTRPHFMAGARDEDKRIWRWHAIEEIEHKAVAYDAYVKVATRGWWGVRRWAARTSVMLVTTYIFFRIIGRNMRDLHAADGADPVETRKKIRAFVFGKDGWMRCILKDYLSYFRPGFHPWRKDDSRLIAEVAREFAAVPGAV